MQSASIRIDRQTHEELKLLARELGTTIGEAVGLAVRRLRQQMIGQDLRAPLTQSEVDWLGAGLG